MGTGTSLLPLRAFAARTELLAADGSHLRFVPAAVAKALIDANHGVIENMNGRVRSVRLIETANTHGHMISLLRQIDGRARGVRFTRRVRSDNHALMWWEFHPRIWAYEN